MERRPRCPSYLHFLAAVFSISSGLIVSANFVPARADTEKEAPLIKRELLFAPDYYKSVTLSQDGQHVTYLAPSGKDNRFGDEDEKGLPKEQNNYALKHYPSLNGAYNVWRRSVEKKDDICLTNEPRSITSYALEKDTSHVLYLTDVGESENHLFRFDPATKTKRDLTPFVHCYVKEFIYKPSVADQALVMMAYKPQTLCDVYRVNLNTGALTMEMQNPGNVADQTFVVDEDLQIRHFLELKPRIAVPWVKAKNAKHFVRMDEIEALDDGPSFMHFSGDGKHALGKDMDSQGFLQVYQFDLEKGKRTKQLSFEKDTNVQAFAWTAKEEVNLIARDIDVNRLKPLTESMSAELNTIKKKWPGDPVIASVAANNTIWLMRHCQTDGPNLYEVYNRKDSSSKFLFSDRPWLRNLTLAQTCEIHYTTRDGLSERALLTKPAGGECAGKPLIVFIHGGPIARSILEYNSCVQWLANRGYVVLQPDFRGSYGYGRKFMRAGFGEYTGKCLQDVMDATEWVVEHQHVNEQKMAVFGASYGGFAVLNLLAQHPGKFRGGIDVCGFTDSHDILNYQKTQNPWSGERPAIAIGLLNEKATAEDAPKRAREAASLAQRIVDPIIVGHGLKDKVVPISHSSEFVNEMWKQNKFCEFYQANFNAHDWLDDNFRAKCENFLAAILGGRAEPPVTPLVFGHQEKP